MTANAIPYGEFLRGLLNNPKAVSAPTPSSPALACAIAQEVQINPPGIVLELGPGTGVVTQALLDRGIARDKIVAIEFEPAFVSSMKARFPGLAVHHGDALQFEQFIPSETTIAAVVSGIPLLNLRIQERRSLIGRALSRGDNRRFIQLSYGWHPPVIPGSTVTVSRKTVWRNFPPAHIWTYERL